MDDFAICDLCGAVVGNQALHSATHDADTSTIVDWLDSLDPDEVWQKAMTDAPMNASPTALILGALKTMAGAS